MRIFARKTTIKQITDELADAFIEEHHRQGNTAYGKNRYNFGLYHGDTLCGVASFSNTRTSGKAKLYQQELVRMAFGDGVQVVGGASKLIKHYIDTVNPRNFFTYQTLSEAKSDVYELSGMTYRSQNATKEVLVKNGHTYDSAVASYRATGEKYLFLNALLVNLGPDQLLGTSIGEVVEDGRRLTNKELFVKHCDYHVETIPGDRVYDYQNPDLVEESTMPVLNVKNCDIHGETLFSGDSCCKCTSDRGLDLGHCEVHGETKFRAGSCLACQVNSATIETLHCETHGETAHKSGKCMKCWSARKTKVCPTHGECKFVGDTCLKCMNQSSVKLKHCEVHGETKHQGNNCCKCVAKKRADARKRKLEEKEIKK